MADEVVTMGGNTIGRVLCFVESCCFRGGCEWHVALEFACFKKVQRQRCL